ncbi:MAG TPA: TIGR03560 family F420-dependent LLM class oxidoreductase [Acidimicrobiia bacterium]|jgi:F420-dependent oxidoreductase-like protein
MTIRLAAPCVVVLVGPSGSGKSTWAAANFEPAEIMSSDELRARVGLGPHDVRASADAFAALELMAGRRIARRLTTVVDTLGLDPELRRWSIDQARAAGLPAYAVGFDTAPSVCRARNKARDKPVPAKTLTGQITTWAATREALAGEGFDGVHLVVADGETPAVPVARRPAALVASQLAAGGQQSSPAAASSTLEFGLQISRFSWPGGPAETGERLAAVAAEAEAAGFTSLWVMDHVVQIPQVGRAWDDMLESYTTLAYLAGVTSRIRLGALVTAVGFRNVAHLAKIVATLDVVSGGRAICGLGAGWYEREARAYGWPHPSARERLDLLEDALELLPLMWGPGTPAYRGRVIAVPEAICYPRPLQERIPVLVGGQGERRTLKLVARHGDMCNLFGDPSTVTAKLAVLRRHCDAEGRDPAEIRVTHFAETLVAADPAELRARVVAGAGNGDPDAYAATVNAGTVEDQVGRYRILAGSGVHTAIVGLVDLHEPGVVAGFAPVVEAFAGPSRGAVQ